MSELFLQYLTTEDDTGVLQEGKGGGTDGFRRALAHIQQPLNDTRCLLPTSVCNTFP